jgi:hypothetical protein
MDEVGGNQRVSVEANKRGSRCINYFGHHTRVIPKGTMYCAYQILLNFESSRCAAGIDLQKSG